MFKFRTLTICLKSRVVVVVVVTVLWEVSRSDLHLVSCRPNHCILFFFLFFNLRLGSGSVQFSPALLTKFPGNAKLTWNEKKKFTRNLHKEQKLHLASCFPVIFISLKKKKRKKNVSCSLRTVPLQNLYSKTSGPSEKSYRIQYITFCLTSLELQNERAGEQKEEIYQVYTEQDCVSTQKSEGTAELHFFFCIDVHDNLTRVLCATSPHPPYSIQAEGG